MSETPPRVEDDLVRLADLEWLDLSDVIRLDDEWRHALVVISYLHLVVTAVIAALVVIYTLFVRPALDAGTLLVVGGVILALAAMAYLLFSTREQEARLLSHLRYVVFLSIVAVSLMVFLLRDLQGDYYLLYLLPLVSAAGYLGFTGGLLAGVASAVAYAITFVLSPAPLSPGAITALALRMLVFVLVASLLGLIAERHLALLSALRASHMQAIQLAIRDGKTGLFNQRYLRSRLSNEIARADRSHTPVSFLVIDVAALDRVNREYGYAAGDMVLHSVGRTIEKELRTTDIPSRWRMDQFAVLLYNSDAHGAEIVAQRIAGDLATETFTAPSNGQAFHVQVAQGIATFPTNTRDRSGRELVDRAFDAMERAKADHSIMVWG